MRKIDPKWNHTLANQIDNYSPTRLPYVVGFGLSETQELRDARVIAINQVHSAVAADFTKHEFYDAWSH